MRAVSQMRENCELQIHTLMICARGPVRKSPTCFTYLMDIWSTPVEQSEPSRLISLRTSPGQGVSKVRSDFSTLKFHSLLKYSF